MAILTIKDLPDSIELDRAAMTAIVGGGAPASRSTFVSMTTTSLPRPSRVFDYPPGFPNAHPGDTASDSRTSTPSADKNTKK